MVASFAFARYEAISPLLYRPALAHGLQVTEVPSYLTESNVAPDGWKTSSFCKGLFSRAMLVWGGASLSCQWHGVVIYFQPYRPKGKTVMHASSHLLWAPWESWLGDLSRRVGRSVKKAPFFRSVLAAQRNSPFYITFAFSKFGCLITLHCVSWHEWSGHMFWDDMFFFCISKDLTSVPVPMSYPLDSSKGPQVWWCMLIRINATHPPPMWFAWKCWGNPSPTLTWDLWERTFAWWDWDFTNF